MIFPRIIRLRDAPSYLGMDKNRFNAEVRPQLRERRMGKQGVAFDRIDLDAWADQYFDRNGCSAKPEESLWNIPNNSRKAVCGVKGRMGRITKQSISKSNIETGGFAALAERLIQKRQSAG